MAAISRPVQGTQSGWMEEHIKLLSHHSELLPSHMKVLGIALQYLLMSPGTRIDGSASAEPAPINTRIYSTQLKKLGSN